MFEHRDARDRRRTERGGWAGAVTGGTPLRLALLLASTLVATPGLATAQTPGAPMFRVPIGGGAPVDATSPIHAWLETVSECSSTCGGGTRTISHQCQDASAFDHSGDGYGMPEADAFCVASAGPKPADATSACVNYSGCGYDWVRPPVRHTPTSYQGNPVGRVGCGYVHAVFAPYCQRTGGSALVVLPSSDHRFCRNDTPDYDQVAAGDPDALGYDRMETQLGSCATPDHEWRPKDDSGWSGWSSTCSNTATRTRPVSCHRRFDNALVDDTRCDASARPTTSMTQGVYASCSYDWIGGGASDWSAWSSTCSTTATRTRNPQCRRSDGDLVSDASCVNAGKPRPTTSETVPVYTGCIYAAGGTTTYGGWSSACSSNAQRSVTRQCIRSNGDVAPDAECTSRGTPVTSMQTQAVYDGCSYAFRTGGWSDWSSRCSNGATRTRSVTCTRSDGATLSDAECANRGAARPPSFETQGVHDGCGYAAGGSMTYGGWSSACSSNAQRGVTRQCIRSDGNVVGSSECTNRGVAVKTTQTAAVYDGCGYGYSTGGWSDWSSRCSTSATRIRSVTCVRSDGAAVADAECTNRGVGRPPTSETTGVYDGCGYEPVNWSGWSACSGGSQSSTAQCRRSDGVVVASAECDGRGMPTRRTQDCRLAPPPGLHGRYCVGGAEVARVETSRSDGYQDPYNGRGPGSNFTSGDPKHRAINCVARSESSWSEYGTYQYNTSVAVYYAESSGVAEEPYMACSSFGCDTQEAWTQ